MSRPLIVIRPEPGCAATLAAARAAGLEAHGFPLFAIRPLAWDPPDPAGIDALLIGSANAVRHAGPGLARFTGLPAYAVGEATAEACRAAGLKLAGIGCAGVGLAGVGLDDIGRAGIGLGGLQAVLDAMAGEHRHLLRLAGRERVPLALPEGTALTERIVYASEALPMPATCARLLSAMPGAVVLLHSAEAARHFAAECDRLALPRAHVRLAALAPRIAAAAGEGWDMRVAAPIQENGALLALARRMCQ